MNGFPVARREPAFRLLLNKPADRAYWLWMVRDPRWETHGERKRGKGREGKGGWGGVGGMLGQRKWREKKMDRKGSKVETQPCRTSYFSEKEKNP